MDQSKTHDDHESLPNSPCNSSIDVVNDFDNTSISDYRSQNLSPSMLFFEAAEPPSKKRREKMR